jgi:hypothetical protein
MYSLVKFAFLALISFAALALAIPSPTHPQDPRALITNTNDPKALITDANLVLERTLLPLRPFYLPFYTSLDLCLLPLAKIISTLPMQHLEVLALSSSKLVKSLQSSSATFAGRASLVVAAMRTTLSRSSLLLLRLSSLRWLPFPYAHVLMRDRSCSNLLALCTNYFLLWCPFLVTLCESFFFCLYQCLGTLLNTDLNVALSSSNFLT